MFSVTFVRQVVPSVQDPGPGPALDMFNLDLTVQGPPLLPCRTCSNLFIMRHVWSTSGRLASYWNAFLLLLLAGTPYKILYPLVGHTKDMQISDAVPTQISIYLYFDTCSYLFDSLVVMCSQHEFQNDAYHILLWNIIRILSITPTELPLLFCNRLNYHI